jgi:hypothetical protein
MTGWIQAQVALFDLAGLCYNRRENNLEMLYCGRQEEGI